MKEIRLEEMVLLAVKRRSISHEAFKRVFGSCQFILSSKKRLLTTQKLALCRAYASLFYVHLSGSKKEECFPKNQYSKKLQAK